MAIRRLCTGGTKHGKLTLIYYSCSFPKNNFLDILLASRCQNRLSVVSNNAFKTRLINWLKQALAHTNPDGSEVSNAHPSIQVQSTENLLSSKIRGNFSDYYYFSNIYPLGIPGMKWFSVLFMHTCLLIDI